MMTMLCEVCNDDHVIHTMVTLSCVSQTLLKGVALVSIDGIQVGNSEAKIGSQTY